jgi:DNA primase
MKLTRWTIALYFGLVFICGGVLGAYGHRLYTVSSVNASAPRNPEEFRKRYMAEMKSRLKLSDDQVTQLSAILDDTRAHFRAARQSIEPEMQKIRDEQQQRISEMLSPEQRTEWGKMRAEREAQIKQRGGRPGPPPPPR